MSLETISSVDVNFSNGGGEHTANISSFENVKNADGSPSLGVVNGEIGSKNYFSQSEINKIMGRFICTSVTRDKSPMGVTISRKYSDITSLILKSYVVLVRGLNAPPDNKDSFDGMFPFFSEVKGSPLAPFPSAGIREMKDKRVLVAGKIYNFESSTVLSGLKASLVYQNGELVNDLSLNRDIVTKNYQNAPYLNAYDLKFGYTLNEYLDMLDYVGVTHNGLKEVENGDKILFQTSGTLDSITSAIASFFGFYYFIDPNSGDLNFIDSKIAANIEITDFTKSSDEEIVSANFSESKFTPEIVNTYVGSADKPDFGTDAGKVKFGPPRESRMQMKRVKFGELLRSGYDSQNDPRVLHNGVLGAFYSLFTDPRVNGNKEIFDVFVYSLLLLQEKYPATAVNGKWNNIDFGNYYKDTLLNFRQMPCCKSNNKVVPKQRDKGGNLDVKSIKDLVLWPETPIDPATNQFEENADKAAYITDAKHFNKKFGRVFNQYYPLERDDTGRMSSPSESELYTVLEGFYKFGGGLYISASLHAQRADNMQITQDAGLDIEGPFKGHEKVSECGGNLKELGVWMKSFTGKEITIANLAAAAGHRNQQGTDFWVGLKSWSKLALNINRQKGPSPWEKLLTDIEMKALYETAESIDVLGHSSINFDLLGSGESGGYIWKTLCRASNKEYDLASDPAQLRDQLTLKWVNTAGEMEGEDDEEEENKSLTGEAPDQEELKSLLQRYDLKSFRVDAPTTEQYTPLSLSVANGSTVEMKALRDAMLKDYQSMNIKPLKSSSKTIYGLEIPSQFNITTNSFSIKVGPDGITTTIGESTLKLLPPDQQFIISQGMEVIGTPSINPRLRASQRNYFGL